jgi:CheY-like chemotaxis protein
MESMPQAEKKLSVMLVDDDEDWLLLMQSWLGLKDLDVSTNCNGREIIEDVKNVRPDLILLDVHMKEVNGEAICRLIKSDSDIRTIPLYMLSSDIRVGEIARNCGAEGSISKAMPIGEMTETIGFLAANSVNSSAR